ncbi:hypothetical protein HYZ05_01510 [Candidatus Daviesbacteria bacterium]|nr:hypothetical protein [Candidatus Daviesbacteria bacterium]
MNHKEREHLRSINGAITGQMMDLYAGRLNPDRTENERKIMEAHYRELLGARGIVWALIVGEPLQTVLDKMEKEYNPSSGWLRPPYDPYDGELGDL